MKYPELANIDSTPDQDLGLTVAYKTYFNGLLPADQPAAPQTAGQYLTLRVMELLLSYSAQHVGMVQTARVATAFDKATPQAKAAAAQALGVDLTVTAPVASKVDAAVESGDAQAPLDMAKVEGEPEAGATPETWTAWALRVMGLK